MQVDTKHSDYQLRGVLHAIAAQPQVQPCIRLILQAALDQTGAAGAVFYASDDLALNVAVGASEVGGFDLTKLPDQLASLQYFAEGRLLAQPVRVPDRYYGVLLLTFAKAHVADDSEREFIESLAESLAIVAARAERDQERSLALSGVFSMVDPLLILDASEQLVLANPAAAALFGSMTVIGNALADIVQSDDLVAFVAGERTLVEWVSGDKTFVPHVQAAVNAAGQPSGWILTLHDVTRFKKLNRNQHEFISIVSHDIRSPMTTIRGFGEMLGNSNGLDDQQKYHLAKSCRASRRSRRCSTTSKTRGGSTLKPGSTT